MNKGTVEKQRLHPDNTLKKHFYHTQDSENLSYLSFLHVT